MGHARALSMLVIVKHNQYFSYCSNGFSVRDVEQIVKDFGETATKNPRKNKDLASSSIKNWPMTLVSKLEVR